MRRFASCSLPWVLLFLAGCATVPTARSGVSRVPSLASQRIFIGGLAYLPAEALVQALEGQGSWDQEAQVWMLRAGTHELRVAAGMPVALVDGSPYRLAEAARFQSGRLLLPEALWSKQLSRWILIPAPAGRQPGPGRSRLATIVVDPGHGGHDPGAIGLGGLREKEVTLDVAKRLRDLLGRDGFRVVMTRYDDRFIPLNQRAQLANREGADLFISIHANASRRRSVSGFEAYYLSEATDDHARALAASENADLPEELGGTISQETQAILWDLLYTEHRTESSELAQQICRGLSGRQIASKNRGIKSARFAVLKRSRMPAVLVEVGFVSHREEESRLRQPWYRQQLAEGIRQGVLSFKQNLERTYALAR